MRKRVYYDAAAAFAFFVIESYGWETFIQLYRQATPESVVGKSVGELEIEFHDYLEPFAAVTVGDVGSSEWWPAMSEIIAAYGRFYEDPAMYSSDQYAQLTLSRLAINRADVANARRFLASSGI